MYLWQVNLAAASPQEVMEAIGQTLTKPGSEILASSLAEVGASGAYDQVTPTADRWVKDEGGQFRGIQALYVSGDDLAIVEASIVPGNDADLHKAASECIRQTIFDQPEIGKKMGQGLIAMCGGEALDAIEKYGLHTVGAVIAHQRLGTNEIGASIHFPHVMTDVTGLAFRQVATNPKGFAQQAVEEGVISRDNLHLIRQHRPDVSTKLAAELALAFIRDTHEQ